LQIANTPRHDGEVIACGDQAERGLNFHRALDDYRMKSGLLAQSDFVFRPTRAVSVPDPGKPLPTFSFLGLPFSVRRSVQSSRMQWLSSIPGLSSVTQITGGRDIGHPREGTAAVLA
jgi:hypothetical protein